MLRRLTYTTLAALTIVACKPADDEDKPATPIEAEDAAMVLAEQLCEQLFACACQSGSGYFDIPECTEHQRQVIEEAINPILDAGGTWDAECAGQLAKAIDQWDCLGPTLGMRASSFDPRACPVLKGTLPLGSDCYRTSLGDDCAEGLACVDNMCIEQPVLPVPEGGICEMQWEQLPCVAGTYCTYPPGSDVASCTPLPALDDPCNPGVETLCGPASNDLICDQASSTCVAAPGEGEPCFEQFLCGPGNYCDGGKDFTCQPRRELGDSCGADTVCPVDASCISSICEPDPALVCNAPNLFF